MLIRKKSSEHTSSETVTPTNPRVVDLQKVIDLRAKMDAAKSAAAAAATATTATAGATGESSEYQMKPVSAASMAVIQHCLRLYREMVPPIDVLTHLKEKLALVRDDATAPTAAAANTTTAAGNGPSSGDTAGGAGVDYRAWEIQAAVFEVILCDSLCRNRYGPSPTYCDQFAKLYIHQIEQQKLDVHDGLYEESARLFKAAVAYSKDRDIYRGTVPRMCAKTFQMSDAKDDTISCYFNEGLNHQVGLSVWPGGLFAAEFVMHHSPLFAGRKCLELGAGIGFTSLAMCRVGAKQVITTDYEPEVVQVLTDNMKTNGYGPTDSKAAGDTKSAPAAAAATSANIPTATATATTTDSKQPAVADRPPPPSTIRVEKLDWFEFDDAMLPRYESDITIASDTIYAPELIPPQMKIFQLLLGAKTPRITSHLSPVPTASPAAPAAPATATATAAVPASGDKKSAAPPRFVPPPLPTVHLTPALYNHLPVVFLILCVRNEDTFAYLLRCLYESALDVSEVYLTDIPRRFTYGRHSLRCFRLVRRLNETTSHLLPVAATPATLPEAIAAEAITAV